VEITNQDTENMLTKIHGNKGSQRNEALQSVQLMTTAHHTGRKCVYQTYNKFDTHVLDDTENYTELHFLFIILFHTTVFTQNNLNHTDNHQNALTLR